MDAWSFTAICLVVPATLFLVIAAAVSSLRMSRQGLRSLLAMALLAMPVAVACVWLGDQPWVGSPWPSVMDTASSVSGFVVGYAVIAWSVRCMNGRWCRCLWRW
jgi:hypothetical protein